MLSHAQSTLRHVLSMCLALVAALGGVQGRLQATGGRHLLQRQPTTTVFMGNMSAFDDGAFDCAANPARCPVGVGKRIPEYALDIPAKVTVDSSTPTLYGSHELSGPQVQELFDLLNAQLVRLCGPAFFSGVAGLQACDCAHMRALTGVAALSHTLCSAAR